jgi:hypothetical protein
MSSGSTEPRRIFEIVIEELGLDVDEKRLTKPGLAQFICDLAEVPWSIVTCESTGSTVTHDGLERVLKAVDILMGN